MKKWIYLMGLVVVIGFTSCFKPVRAEFRVKNYYIEPLTDVTVGAKELYFENVEKQTTSDYQSLTPGNYSVIAFSSSGVKFSTVLKIEPRKGGRFTLLIDGTGRASIQNDNR